MDQQKIIELREEETTFLPHGLLPVLIHIIPVLSLCSQHESSIPTDAVNRFISGWTAAACRRKKEARKEYCGASLNPSKNSHTWYAYMKKKLSRTPFHNTPRTQGTSDDCADGAHQIGGNALRLDVAQDFLGNEVVEFLRCFEVVPARSM